MNAKIIEIEGVDRSGKETQCKMLENKLKSKGYKVLRVSFPNYASDSSYFVKKYLNGDFGNVDSLNAYQASMFYAMDRLITYKQQIEPVIDEYDFIILDRYVLSNLIHQGSKYIEYIGKNKIIKEGYLLRPEYYEFIDNWYKFELIKLELPIPDSIIFLDMPIDLGNKIAKNRKNKSNNSDKQDIHESNNEFMMKSYKSAKLLSFSDFGIKTIKCYKNALFGRKKIRTIQDIHNEIFNYIKSNYNIPDQIDN